VAEIASITKYEIKIRLASKMRFHIDFIFFCGIKMNVINNVESVINNSCLCQT